MWCKYEAEEHKTLNKRNNINTMKNAYNDDAKIIKITAYKVGALVSNHLRDANVY